MNSDTIPKPPAAAALRQFADLPGPRGIPVFGNLLEAMLVAADEPGSGMDDKPVAGNVPIMLLAGEDTTTNTIAWMIHLLWRHPAALARATEEVRRVCAEPTAPTLDEVAQLDCIDACINETMRLKPVAPQNGMQALRDTTLGDVHIPTTGMAQRSRPDADAPRQKANRLDIMRR